jgi:hypothetical protein
MGPLLCLYLLIIIVFITISFVARESLLIVKFWVRVFCCNDVYNTAGALAVRVIERIGPLNALRSIILNRIGSY